MDSPPITNKHQLLQTLISDFPPAEIPLDLAVCAIAIPHRLGVDVSKIQNNLDLLADATRDQIQDSENACSVVEAIRTTLFTEFGFQGNHEDYYTPDNSFIDQVLASKKGIPITLSIIMIEVGKRLGIDLFGIGLPCHFLVGHSIEDQLRLYDPFHNGEEKSLGECVEMIHLLSGGSVTIDEGQFVPASPRSMLIRMLMNLRGIYRSRQKTDHLVSVLEQLLIIGPEEASIHAELAASLAIKGDLKEAHRHLESYSQMVGNLPEEYRDADWVRQIRAHFSTYN